MSGKFRAILLSVGAFYLVALPLILLEYNVGRAAVDEQLGHLLAIRFFTHHLSFFDYPSATTPGYHLLMALMLRIFPGNILLLKLLSSLFTALLIGISAGLLHARAGHRTPLVLLPMILSLYILPGGVWLVPDNLAWLSVLLMYLAAFLLPPGVRFFLISGTCLCAAVLVRQSNLWLAAVPWSVGLWCLLHADRPLHRRLRCLGAGLLSTLPAFLLLLWFFLTWKGLVPPGVQGRHEQHLSWSVPCFFLSVFFIYALWYTPLVLEGFREILRKHALLLFLGGFLGLAVALLPLTGYDYEAGRFSGLWNFVRLAPTVWGRSLLLAFLSPLGGILLTAWLLLMPHRTRLVLLATIPAFVLAMIPNTLVLERYFAGYVFLLIIFLLSQAKGVDLRRLPKGRYLGAVLFAVINLSFLCRGLWP